MSKKREKRPFLDKVLSTFQVGKPKRDDATSIGTSHTQPQRAEDGTKTEASTSTTPPLIAADTSSGQRDDVGTKARSSGAVQLQAVVPPGDSAKPTEAFHLEPFKMLNVTPGAGLDKAQERLHRAFEELEIVLREERSSEKYALDTAEITQTDEPGESMYSFSEMVMELQKHHDERQEKKHIKVGNFIVAAMPATKLLLNVTGTVARNVGIVGPVNIATNGLTQILDIVMAPNTNADDVLSGLDLSLMDQYLINQLEVLPRNEFNNEILRRALHLQTALIDFLRIGLQWLRYTYVSKVGRVAIGIDKVQASKSSLQVARDGLRRSISDDLYLEYKRKSLEDRTEKELDKVCPQAEYLHHLAIQRQELHVQRLAGTAESVIQDAAYPVWGEGGLTTLWCTGLAGAGKTFTASAVIDNLELYIRGEKNVGLAYFFCSFAQRQNQSQPSILAALTRQLIARKQTTGNLQIHGEFPTLDERKQLFRHTVAHFNAVYIVIDAFDEFSTDHNQRLALAEDLGELSKGSKCYFCITSRAADDVLKVLPNAQEVYIRASEAEIRKYVKYRLQEDKGNSHAKQLARQDPTLLDDLTESILTKSDRIFKLAELQLKEALLGSNPQEVRDKLETLTSDIDDYYKNTLERINESKMKGTILKLLTWVVHCKTPVSIGQMSVALGTIPKRIDQNNFEHTGRWLALNLDYYVSACEGLLSVQDASNPKLRELNDTRMIALAHETVDAFFRDNRDKLLTTPNCMILKHCFAFLQSLDLTAVQYFEGPRAVETPANLTQILYLGLALDAGRLIDWADGRSDEFPGDERFQKAVPIALFSTIAEYWGEYAEDAISEDAAGTAMIRAFLEAYDKIPPTMSVTKSVLSWNSLHYCASRNWCAPLQLLIDRGMDINTPMIYTMGDRNMPHSWDDLTPFGLAVSSRRRDVFRMLVKDNRVDVNAKPDDGNTPLMQCANICWKDSPAETYARELLARPDVKVNEKNNEGHTALLLALQNGYRDIAYDLLHDPRLSLEENGFDDTVDKASIMASLGPDNPETRRQMQWVNEQVESHGLRPVFDEDSDEDPDDDSDDDSD